MSSGGLTREYDMGSWQPDAQPPPDSVIVNLMGSAHCDFSNDTDSAM